MTLEPSSTEFYDRSDDAVGFLSLLRCGSRFVALCVRRLFSCLHCFVSRVEMAAGIHADVTRRPLTCTLPERP